VTTGKRPFIAINYCPFGNKDIRLEWWTLITQRIIRRTINTWNSIHQWYEIYAKTI